MDSIENLFSYMTPSRLMIKIWEYSHHVLHVSLDESFDYKCQEYLNMCIELMLLEMHGTLKIIFILTLLCIGFNFTEKKYVSLMSLKNEDYKEQLVESILRGER